MGIEYDEAASAAHHMDVVHEFIDEDTRAPVVRWVEAMRRLNHINDPLARSLLEVHRECGGGNGECDSWDEPHPRRAEWGCETTRLIAEHYGVEYPTAPQRGRPDHR